MLVMQCNFNFKFQPIHPIRPRASFDTQKHISITNHSEFLSDDGCLLVIHADDFYYNNLPSRLPDFLWFFKMLS